MYYLIQDDGQVVSDSEVDFGAPSGMFFVVSDLRLSSDAVYYDASEGVIVPKPPKPGDKYFWDALGKTWVEYVPPIYTPPEPQRLSTEELIPLVYTHLQEIDPILAEVLAIMLFKSEGNLVEVNNRVESLRELFTPA